MLHLSEPDGGGRRPQLFRPWRIVLRGFNIWWSRQRISRWIINRRFLKSRFFPHFCSHKKRLNPKFHRVFEVKWKARIITLLEGKTSDYKDAIFLPPVLWDAPDFITRRRWDTDWFRQALVERKIMARGLRRNFITTRISFNRQNRRHIINGITINGTTIHATTERNEDFFVKLKECRCRATHSNTLWRMRILTLLNHLRFHYYYPPSCRYVRIFGFFDSAVVVIC